jgi:TPR repeat protein
MTAAQKVFGIACYAALLFVSDLAYSQRSSELSADLPDSRTMATQDKVDALFDTGDFERAFFIYRNELAPIGDKYAQYMVGYMYLTGMGVEEDRIAASAWYRLSAERGTAERGTAEFIAVRDRLMRNMNENEVRLSDAQYNQLRFEYCDLAVLLSSIKRNFKEVETKTGSRIQRESNAMTVIDSGGGRVWSGADYYGLIHAQLEDRLKLMQELGDFQDMEMDPQKVNLRELERNVMEHIASFE